MKINFLPNNNPDQRQRTPYSIHRKTKISQIHVPLMTLLPIFLIKWVII